MQHMPESHRPQTPRGQPIPFEDAGAVRMPAVPQPAGAEPELEVLEHKTAVSPIPSSTEIKAYISRSEAVTAAGRLSAQGLLEATREALEMRTRLLGDSATSGVGGLSVLEVRRDWAKQAYESITQQTLALGQIYQEPASHIIRTVVDDFLHRVRTLVPRLLDPHSANAVSTCLEQTRLMLIFAGKALKSEDHVQSALSGLQERSFAGNGSQTAPESKERNAEDRRSAFEARQAARAAASAAKKAALKNGEALPVRDAPPPPPKDEEKSELLTATAAHHRNTFDDARPTDEQRRALRQMDKRDMDKVFADRLTQPKGPERDQALETIRTEVTNVIANRFRDWLSTETQFAKHLGKSSLTKSDIPLDTASAASRLREVEEQLKQVSALKDLVLKDLKRFALSVVGNRERVGGLFTPQELAALDQILNPPKEKETYELAD